jgi:ureidoglycolate lyase
MARTVLAVERLTRAAFAAFGDVIAIEGSRHYTINDGHAERHHDLATVDVDAAGGRPLINIFRARPWPLPLRIAMVERHPLSSQAFIPLAPVPFLLIVAAAGDAPRPGDLRAFVTDGLQGVNYARGTWHHPVLALDRTTDFLVVDRGGPGENCDVTSFGDEGPAVDWPSADPANQPRMHNPT